MKSFVVLGNSTDWCRFSLGDMKYVENAKVLNYTYPCPPKGFLTCLIRLHYSPRFKGIIPLKSIWYSYFCRHICSDRNCELCLVIYDRNKIANEVPFLLYLRRYFKNIKLVYMFTNVVRISGANEHDFIGSLSHYYDVIYAFDPSDAIKYSFKYSPLIYSKNRNVNIVKNGVFYVGRAKDRFAMLISVFNRLKELGIDRRFFVFNVPDDKQVHTDEIIYNQLIPYDKVLNYIEGADCLLDVIQGDSEGMTIKVCEAVFYDKLLITTNKKIKELSFYSPDKILVIDKPDDINLSFFDNRKKIKYSKKDRDYFSVRGFISRLNRDLGKNYKYIGD